MNLLNIIISLSLNIVFIILSFEILKFFINLKINPKIKAIFIGINMLCFVIGTIFSNCILTFFVMLFVDILFSIIIFKIPSIISFVYFSLKSVIFLNVCLLFSKFMNINEISISPLFYIVNFAIILAGNLMFFFSSKKIFSDSLFIMAIYDYSPSIITISVTNILVVILSFLVNLLLPGILDLADLNLFFVVSFYSVFCIFQNKYFRCKTMNLELKNTTLQDLCDNTRAFNHDFNNIIQAIGGYVYINDMNGLKNYYYDVLDDCRKMNSISKLTPDAINNPAIYSILVSKYNMASSENIEMNFNFSTDLNNVKIRTYEFIRILGILLDNAIEASKVCIDKKINVFFKQDNCKKMLIIENTYENKQISIDEIFEKNYTTKSKNSGLGLWEVKQIIDKSANLDLHTSKNSDYFSQQLEIYTA